MTNHTDLLRRALDELKQIKLDSRNSALDNHILNCGLVPLRLYDDDKDSQASYTRITNLITDLRTAIETGGWMPIDEKAKDGTWWLCLHESRHRNIMQFCSEGFWRTNCDAINMGWNPIMYMPVPPAPLFTPDEETTSKWESGELGRSEEHAEAVPAPPVAELNLGGE